MNYREYQGARDMAWRILLREGICALPVGIVGLCGRLGIAVQGYTPQDQKEGFSVIMKGQPVIYVRRDRPKTRKRFTVAHELGHILLGHVGEYPLSRDPLPQDDPREKAANAFAVRILAPACVLWGCGVQTPEEIAALCGISLEAAAFRAGRLALLRQRNKFLTSPLERAVYEQFQPFITCHRQAAHLPGADGLFLPR